MGSPGGYQINPGLYRVPDLLTEEQLVNYMKNTYGRTIEFTDGIEVNPARALGQSHPVGPVDEVDSGKMSPNAVNDPTLRQLNNMNFDFKEEPDVGSVETEPALDAEPMVSLDSEEEPVPVTSTGQVEDAPPLPEPDEYPRDFPNDEDTQRN